MDKNVGDRTRSKLQAICNSIGQEVYLPLYDVFILKDQDKLKHVNLQLRATACQIYHSTLTGSKSQTELDCLHQLHALDMVEDDKDRSWKCTKVLKYCEEIGMNTSTIHKCLVE